jgi:hypothetical protein
MKKQMIEFLSSRLCEKVSLLRNNSFDEDAMDFILDDIETYADTLVSIAKELITP